MLCKLISICLFCDIETIGFCIFVCMFVSDDTTLSSSAYIVKPAGCSPSAVQSLLNRSLGGQSAFNLARYPLGGLFWLPPSILRVIKARPRWKSPPGFAYLCRAARTKTQGQWKFPEQTPSVSPPDPSLFLAGTWSTGNVFLASNRHPPPPTTPP